MNLMLGTNLETNMPEEITSVNNNLAVCSLKGPVATVHDAIEATATSSAIDCRGYNAVLISVAISVAVKNWTFKVQGALSPADTFADCYELANTGSMAAMSYQTNASKVFLFKGIPDYIKIVATEDEDGATVTVKFQPLNV